MIDSISSVDLRGSYERISTGSRINSAADDAAGLAISEKIESQLRGLEKGTDNARDMQGLLNTAEGGLNTISDALLRIRELGVQASNGIYTQEDKEILQMEASQMLDQIKSAAQYTEFNNMKLLDGSFADKNTASNPSGIGMSITIKNASLSSLGIEDFDLTGDFDLSKIDDAINMVNEARSNIGSKINRLDYTISSNETSYINQAQAKSRIADTDIAKEVINMNTKKVLQDYRLFSQKQMMDREADKLMILR